MAAVVLIYSITAVLVLQRFGVPLAGLVAPATVAGVALGFGAQRIPSRPRRRASG
jgi:small conductance mechanosensitive channel